MSPIKEATTWPDAGIAIAGIGFVTAVSMTLIWQIFSTLRSRLSTPSDVKSIPNAPVHAQGEAA
jgi:hypothetical protein